jgi:hypothetical protein
MFFHARRTTQMALTNKPAESRNGRPQDSWTEYLLENTHYYSPRTTRTAHYKLMASAEGIWMSILGFARGPKDITAVVQALRDHGISVIGPFRSSNGTFLYSLADCVVTDRELLDLAITGKLDAAGVSELSAKIMRKGA